MGVCSRLSAVLLLAASSHSWAQKAELPTPADFRVGDTWEWRQLDNYTKVEEGRPTRTVVDQGGVLMFYGMSPGAGATVEPRQMPISASLIGPSETNGGPPGKPWRSWPLEVGKKWPYVANFARTDGSTSYTEQDAEVTAYEDVTVPAGTFKAFRIEHKGWWRNSRGNSGRARVTYWYAPEVKADVKIVYDDGWSKLTRELTSYKLGNPPHDSGSWSTTTPVYDMGTAYPEKK